MMLTMQMDRLQGELFEAKTTSCGVGTLPYFIKERTRFVSRAGEATATHKPQPTVHSPQPFATAAHCALQ